MIISSSAYVYVYVRMLRFLNSESLPKEENDPAFSSPLEEMISRGLFLVLNILVRATPREPRPKYYSLLYL
jgi:hypothetical protein